AIDQQWLRLCVFLLSQEGAAEQRLRVEYPPIIRQHLGADSQGLAQNRLGLGKLLLLEQVEAEAGQGGGGFRVVRAVLFPILFQGATMERLSLGELTVQVVHQAKNGGGPFHIGWDSTWELPRSLYCLLHKRDGLSQAFGVAITGRQVDHGL